MVRKEMIDKSDFGNTIQNTLNEGMIVSKELEVKLWKKILEKKTESKLNILNPKSSNKIKTPIEFLELEKEEYCLIPINLQLDSAEFENRCTMTLKKGSKLQEGNINSFLLKYKESELRRIEAIKDVELSTNITFIKWDAVEYESKIISEQMKNGL